MLDWFARRLKEAQEKDKTGQGGFTLIELLVVIIIIGILAAIAIPTFLAQRDRARAGAVQSDLRNAATAAQQCASQNNDSYVGCDTVAQLTANGYRATPNVTLTFPAAATATRIQINGDHTNAAAGAADFSFDSNTGTVTAIP